MYAVLQSIMCGYVQGSRPLVSSCLMQFFFCHLPRPRLYVCDVSYAHARVYLSFCLFGNNKGIIYSSHCMLEIVLF